MSRLAVFYLIDRLPPSSRSLLLFRHGSWRCQLNGDGVRRLVMWFLGSIIGAILGSIGDARGALLGAIVGAGVAWALSQKSRGPGEERLERLESAIRLLQQRVTSLE